MAASIGRSILNRAVHLKITPRPSNLGETREIMRLISQIGEVECFKNLKYDRLPTPNAAMVVFKDEGHAQECLHRSPIRFRMGRAIAREHAEVPGERLVEDTAAQEDAEAREKATTSVAPSPDSRLSQGPLGAPFGLGTQTRALSTATSPGPQAGRPSFGPPSPSSLQPEQRMFQILVHRSSRHLRDKINSAHFHGGFDIDQFMIGQEDLAKRVPVPGLSCVDFRAKEKPWRLVYRERKREEQGPNGRRNLMELWEEGERAAAGTGGTAREQRITNGRGEAAQEERGSYGGGDAVEQESPPYRPFGV